MEVILLQDIYKLGAKNDVVSVRPGYANNYLIPRGYAIQATARNRTMHEENLRQMAFKLNKIKTAAEYLASQMKDVHLKVSTLVGKEGRIYGSVTPLQIANLLKEKGFDIDRKKIELSEEIKQLGLYSATIQLHREVNATISFEVVEKEME